MRTWIFILLTALCLAGFSACFYSDSDLYYVEPTPAAPPQISIGTTLDTFHLPEVRDSLGVHYQVEISGGELYYVKAELAQSLIYESDSIQGFFWITPFMADSSGIDTLHMEFYYSTNTNSLADMMGYEALIKNKKYPLEFLLGGAK